MVRPGGRKRDQMRPVKITRNYIKHAEGSVLAEFGDTRVICTATVEERVPIWLRDEGKGWVTGEYSMLPRSTGVRTARESGRGRIGGRTHEIQRLIGRSLRAVTDLKALGERTVILDCDVIQADGGTRTASITGAFVALADALGTMVRNGQIDKMPLRDFVAAVSVGVVEGETVLDLCYEEDSMAEVDMNIVMTGAGKYVEIQGTGEEASFSRDEVNQLLDLAGEGIKDLIAYQREVLGDIAQLIKG